MNASILLTQQEPTVDLATKEIDLGWHHDGVFIVDGYPCRIEAGGVVEVRYRDSDAGIHEIEVYGVLDGDQHQEHPICAPFIHEIPNYDASFGSMTMSIDTFALAANVEGDLDMLLRVDIDRTTYAQTRIAVRSTTLMVYKRPTQRTCASCVACPSGALPRSPLSLETGRTAAWGGR